jgi:hypothetical protein
MTWSLVLLSPLARVELESLVSFCGMVWEVVEGRESQDGPEWEELGVDN